MAVHSKKLSLFKYVAKKVGNSNPKLSINFSILHYAAYHGQFEICNFIINDTEDMNSIFNVGNFTPLHKAALYGHYDIIKLFLENLEDKNPKGK